MTWKRFVHRALAAALLLPAAFYLLVNVLADPYRETGWLQGSFNRYKPAQTHCSAFPLADDLRRAPSILVLGTSRTRYVSEKLTGMQTLNFHGLYANPLDVLPFLESLDATQRANIQKVYYLLDFHIFSSRQYRRNADLDYGSTGDRLSCALGTTSPYKLRDAYLCLRESFRGTPPRFRLGATVEKAPPYDGRNAANPSYFRYDREGIRAMERVAAWFSKHKINVVYFTPPIYRKGLEKFLPYREEICALRRELLAFLPPVADLTRAREITDREALFFNDDHLNEEGTRRLLELLDQETYRIDRRTVSESPFCRKQ